jgi:hypothetical protein
MKVVINPKIVGLNIPRTHPSLVRNAIVVGHLGGIQFLENIMGNTSSSSLTKETLIIFYLTIVCGVFIFTEHQQCPRANARSYDQGPSAYSRSINKIHIPQLSI